MTDLCYPKSQPLLTVEQAMHHIRQAITAIEDSETIDIAHALGRVLAETVVSPLDIPPHRSAAMDGYAYTSRDISPDQAVSLQLVGCAWAGKPFSGEIAPGQCVRIFTGAVVPAFADSVVAQEQVSRDGDHISFPSDTPSGKNIRPAGSDVAKQAVLIAAPKLLSPADLGLLASAGIARITVKRRLKIGFFSTGDELAALGQALQPGQIYDSNRYLLSGLLVDPNHEAIDLGVVPDDPQQLEQTLSDASKPFDVLISTGGASVGEADFVQQTLAKCGEVNFWKLAIKPGKPLAFGKVGRCWFFGLPGNPVAVLVTYKEFVSPALRQLAGLRSSSPLQLKARCQVPLRKSPGRQEYQRGILSQAAPGEFNVTLAGRQDSHQLQVASLANCFIVLDAQCAGIKAGEMVSVEPFGMEL